MMEVMVGIITVVGTTTLGWVIYLTRKVEQSNGYMCSFIERLDDLQKRVERIENLLLRNKSKEE